MKLSKSAYRAIACTLLIIAGGLYYFNKTELPPPPVVQEAKADDGSANITFFGSKIVEQQDGKKQWEVEAESVQMNPGTNRAQLINFQATLYRADGSKLHLVGRQAELDTKTRDIHMSGDIKATNSDGAVFTSATARWAAKERKFFGGGGITMTRGDTVVTGDRVEGDEQLEKVKVFGNARAVKGGTPQ